MKKIKKDSTYQKQLEEGIKNLKVELEAKSAIFKQAKENEEEIKNLKIELEAKTAIYKEQRDTLNKERILHKETQTKYKELQSKYDLLSVQSYTTREKLQEANKTIEQLRKDIKISNSKKEMLRSADDKGNYNYRPNSNRQDSKDITSVVRGEIERYTRFTVAPLVTENFPDIEEIDFIVVTGGGASLLAKEALKDEIGEEYFERLFFLNESEFANVRGFYKGGYLKWHISNDDSLQIKNSLEKVQTSLTNFEAFQDEKELVIPSNETINTLRSQEVLEAQKKLQALESEIEGIKLEFED